MNVGNELWERNRPKYIHKAWNYRKVKTATEWKHFFWGFAYMYNRSTLTPRKLADFIITKLLDMIMEDLLDGKAVHLPNVRGGFLIIGKQVFTPYMSVDRKPVKVKRWSALYGIKTFREIVETPVLKESAIKTRHLDFLRNSPRFKRMNFHIDKRWKSKAIERNKRGYNYQIIEVNYDE